MTTYTTKFLKVLSVISFLMAGGAKSYALPKIDSTKSREILTSQQLFIVEISHVKGEKDVRFKAELRDAFKIICYDKDHTFTELNWVLCPDGQCPIPGTYNAGTAEYRHLDAIIANSRKNSAKLKRLDKLAKEKPRIDETFTERL